MYKRKLLAAMFGAAISLGLGACGSDSDSSSNSGLSDLSGGSSSRSDESGTGTTVTGSESNPARAIEITYPRSNAIVDEGGGVYSKRGSAVVTDAEGNPVPDGTKVYMNLIDSILARGTIDNGDSLNGSTLTDMAPLSGATTDTATTFDQAYVYRNYAYRFIEPGDHVVLFDADETDKNRLVDDATGNITANILTMSTAYTNAYPSTVYPADGTTQYYVGASTLGAQIIGQDAEGNTVNGYSVTKDGVAEFNIVYPSDVNSIHSGCLGENDLRSFPYGSAEVFVIASAGEHATTIDNSACFSSISPWSLAAIPTSLGTSGGEIEFNLQDGGDGVSLPFTEIKSKVVLSGTITVSVDFYDSNDVLTGLSSGRTYANGTAKVLVSVTNPGASGDEARITFYTNDPAGSTLEYTITTP